MIAKITHQHGRLSISDYSWEGLADLRFCVAAYGFIIPNGQTVSEVEFADLIDQTYPRSDQFKLNETTGEITLGGLPRTEHVEFVVEFLRGLTSQNCQ